MDDFYQYSKILDQSTIRLVLLQPSRDLNAEIICSLVHVPLQELDNDITEHYVALSYVWGDPKLSYSVLVDEKRVQITSSLDCALRHLREPTRVLRLWADGICINQSDTEDRNQQVRLMRSIYSMAQHTVIFLGASNAEAESIIQHIVAKSNSTFQKLSTKHRGLTDDSKATLQSSIMSNAWFTRVWVCQELVLSVDPWVQYGKARVRWDQFCQFAIPKSNSVSNDPGISRAAGMNRIREEHRKSKLNDVEKSEQRKSRLKDAQKSDPSSNNMLLKILLTRRGAGVSDPRDMLYGHLGLLPSHIEWPIDIDYGKSVSQIYEDFAHYFISKDRSLYFLNYVESSELDDRIDGLPSWVPDWTRGGREREVKFSYSFVPFGDYGFPRSVPHTLVYKGLEFGRIRYLIKRPSASDLSDSQERVSADIGQPFDKCLKLGRFDTGGTFGKFSSHNPFKDRITGFKLKHHPETILDACKQIYADFYDEIDQKMFRYQTDPTLKPTISRLAHEFNISTDHIPSKYNALLEKFARLLLSMEKMAGYDGPLDPLIAVLDTGGFLLISNKAQVNDSICGRNLVTEDFFIFRHTSAAESKDMVERLERDQIVRQLAEGHTGRPIQIGRFVSNTDFSIYGFYNLSPFDDARPILIALH